jgi:hypothetical protein
MIREIRAEQREEEEDTALPNFAAFCCFLLGD